MRRVSGSLPRCWQIAYPGLCLLGIPAPAFAQQPQQTPATAAQAAPKPPIFNRVNDALPSWLRVRGEFRERMEGFDGSGFVDDRKDLYYLSRVRLNATVTPTSALSFQVQGQDARVARKTCSTCRSRGHVRAPRCWRTPSITRAGAT